MKLKTRIKTLGSREWKDGELEVAEEPLLEEVVLEAIDSGAEIWNFFVDKHGVDIVSFTLNRPKNQSEFIEGLAKGVEKLKNAEINDDSRTSRET